MPYTDETGTTYFVQVLTPPLQNIFFLSKEELQQYVQAGFIVYLYKNRDDCKADVYTTTFPRAIRFQEGGTRHTRRCIRRRPITRRRIGRKKSTQL
jgi:hypothetical protein